MSTWNRNEFARGCWGLVVVLVIAFFLVTAAGAIIMVAVLVNSSGGSHSLGSSLVAAPALSMQPRGTCSCAHRRCGPRLPTSLPQAARGSTAYSTPNPPSDVPATMNGRVRWTRECEAHVFSCVKRPEAAPGRPHEEI